MNLEERAIGPHLLWEMDQVTELHRLLIVLDKEFPMIYTY